MGSKCSKYPKCSSSLCCKPGHHKHEKLKSSQYPAKEPNKNFNESISEVHRSVENSAKDSLISISIDDSLLTIEKIINKCHNNPEILLKVACHLFEKKKFSQSAEIFENILKAEVKLDLKSIIVYIKLLIQEGKYEESKNMIEEYLQIFPSSDQLIYLNGEISAIEGQTDIAKSCIRRALKINPNNPEYYNIYGLSLMKEKKFAKALKFFLKAFELDPEMAKALNNAGNAYRKLGNTLEAIKCYKAAIDKVPRRKFPIALINLATTCFYTGDIIATLDFFEEALQTGSNIHKIMVKKGYHLLFKSTKTKLALELLHKHEVNKALALLYEILKNDPNNPVVCYYLATALAKINKNAEANEMFRSCVENGQKPIFLNMQFVKHYVKRANKVLNSFVTKQPCAEIPEVDEDSENSTINVANFEVFKVRAVSLLKPYRPRDRDSPTDSPVDTSVEEDVERCVVV